MSRAEVGDRIIVNFVEEPTFERFDSDDWPYHITLLPWYKIDDSKLINWDQRLKEIADSYKPFQAEVGEEDYFGNHRDILVGRLAVESFRPLHYRLLNSLQDVDGTLRDRSHTGKDFRPHITQRYEALLPKGFELTVAGFSEVMKIDRDADGNSRHIVHNYYFRQSGETAA